MFNSKKFLIEMEYGEDKDDLTTWSNKEDAVEYAVETLQTCLTVNFQEYMKPISDIDKIKQNNLIINRTLIQWKLIMKSIDCYYFLEDKFKLYEELLRHSNSLLKFNNKLILDQEYNKINNEFNIELNKRRINKIMKIIDKLSYEMWGLFRKCLSKKQQCSCE